MTIEIKYYTYEGELVHPNASEVSHLISKDIKLSIEDEELPWTDVMVFFLNNLPAFGYPINRDVLDNLTDAIYNKGECDGFITKEDYLQDLESQKREYEVKIARINDQFALDYGALLALYNAEVKKNQSKRKKGK